MNGINRLNRTQGFIRIIIAAITLLLAAALALAGNLDNAAAPSAGSGMPTLQGIYQQLLDGTTATTSGTFQEPAAGPTAGTGRTLAEIQGKLPVADNTNGAAAGDVLLGKTFWGLRTDGTWGLKTGAGDANLVSGNIKSGVSIFGVSGNVIPATGTATAAHVLSGVTFSNGTAAGLSGTMANNGAVIITPGTSSQAIPAGYHNGSGWVYGDANLTAGNILFGTTIFGVMGISVGKRVNKTGQTTCSNMGLSISCAGTGQDGEYQYGVSPALVPGGDGNLSTVYNTPSYSGSAPRFVDNGDGTVTDNMTALTWLKDGSCISQKTWLDALAACNSLASGTCGLADVSHAGLWRLPNINELHSLGPTWGIVSPFSGPASGYWSSTTFTVSGTLIAAWFVDFNSGNADAQFKNNSFYVRCVRGGQ